MKITSLTSQKNDKDRYNVFIDGIYSFSAEAMDILKYSIKVDKEYQRDELNSLILECEASKALNYALNLVSKRDYTSKEIEKKLLLRGYNENTIEKTLIKLVDLGVINDVNYAERFIKDGINLKKQGKNKIFYDLQQKGISKEVLENFCFDDVQEYNNALKIGEKKYLSIKDKPNAKDKLFRFLIGRGYEYDVVKKIMNQLLNMDVEFIES